MSMIFDPEGNLSFTDDVLSLEDQAWADSCFVRDSEILNSDWDSFKNALQEIDSSSFYQFPVSEIDYVASPTLGTTDDNSSSDDSEGQDENSDSDTKLDNIIKSRSKKTKNGVNPFRPNYNEHLQESESSELGLDFDPFDFSSDTLAKDIFKVWDLGIPAEEVNELINDFEALNDLKNGSLDDIIAGISDLSLGQNSS